MRFLGLVPNEEVARLPGFVEEIRAVQPDLVYTWGTPVTLGIAGRYDATDKAKFVTDIPIVFALVASPTAAGLVADRAIPNRNLTGAVHVVPTDTQLRAMHSYRPITRLGVLYSASEQNSVSIVQEARVFRCASITADRSTSVSTSPLNTTVTSSSQGCAFFTAPPVPSGVSSTA